MMSFNEYWVFSREALRDFNHIASILPSTASLVCAMVKPLKHTSPTVVVELGAGTGAITAAILGQLPANTKLYAFEPNPRFQDFLRNRFNDKRLCIIDRPAETMRRELHKRGCARIDAAISSMGMGYMSPIQRHQILVELTSMLTPGGFLTHFQFAHGLQMSKTGFIRFDMHNLLARYFQTVKRRTIWRNLPPAFVYEARSIIGTDDGKSEHDASCRESSAEQKTGRRE